jgi:hypothetical protein
MAGGRPGLPARGAAALRRARPGRRPRPHPSRGLAHRGDEPASGRLPPAFACLTGDRSMAPIMLITRLAALAEAVAGLRDAQQHAAQAAAARAAAERLYAAARPAPPAQPRPAQRASTAAQLARLSFPSQPGQLRQDSPVRLQAGRHQSHGRHHQGHAAPPADDATTHSSAHQITALAPESDATAAAAAR